LDKQKAIKKKWLLKLVGHTHKPFTEIIFKQIQVRKPCPQENIHSIQREK
jgi:hypothetical protein